MSRLDERLFACHTTSGYDETEWREILAHVILQLEAFLSHRLTVHEIDFFPDGFAGDIRSGEVYGGLLQLSWFGRIGVTVLGHRERTCLEATLFLQAAGKRLIANDGNDYLWLTYDRLASDQYAWQMKWLPDEYGEYEHWGPADDAKCHNG